jgi:hypothetical protein
MTYRSSTRERRNVGRAVKDRFPVLVAGIVVAAMLVMFAPFEAQACAVCWDGSPDDLFSRAMNSGILFLMAMPFAIAGSIGGWLFYKYRRSAGNGRRLPASDDALPASQLIQKESLQ